MKNAMVRAFKTMSDWEQTTNRIAAAINKAFPPDKHNTYTYYENGRYITKKI